MDIKEKAKNLPSSPGVYLMKDSLGNIIYVGKSKRLKNRVGSYFQNSKSHPPKVLKMVKNIRDFEYILTDTEFEAFMLECRLIREIKPPYNKKMKNPLSYAYVEINLEEKCPYIKVSPTPDRENGSLCWGPYTSRNTVEKGVLGIKESCRILCSGNSKKASPCLNYTLGLCMGMCLEETPREEYLEVFHKIAGLLDGTDMGILEEMEHAMNSFSEKFDFENAAKYRDYINAVNYLIKGAKVIEFTETNKNIAILEPLNDDTIKLFLIRGHRVLFSQKYPIGSYALEELIDALEEKVFLYFKGSSDPVEISSFEVDESQIIYTYLRSKDNSCSHVIIPQAWVDNKNLKKIHAALKKLLRM